MKELSVTNPIRMNHVGFTRKSAKRFLIEAPEVMRFEVEYLEHTKYTVVYEGELRETCEVGLYEGEFSELTKPGDYRIRLGKHYSRHFVIYDKAYDMAERLLQGYFTLQRCGSPLGWSGVCHQDDGIIYETGEHIDLRGGYHQSCDLRKSSGGVPIGVLGLFRYSFGKRPLWDQGCIDDELRWALDYYLKTVQPNGCVYNTLNAPLGWDGRVFYASGAPASAQWNVMTILLYGARVFASERDYRARLLEAAERIYNYLDRPDRPYEHYKNPEHEPLGMDADNFFITSYRDSTADLLGRLGALVAFYRATGEYRWRAEIEKTANAVCECFVGDNLDENPAAGCLRFAKDELRLMECMGSYGWAMPGLNALFDAYETLPHSPHAEKWLERLDLAVRQREMLATLNPWKRVGQLMSEENRNIRVGNLAPGYKPPTVGSTFEGKPEFGYVEGSSGRAPCFYRVKPNPVPSIDMTNALIFMRAARVFNRPQYLPLAQAQIDGIMGMNQYDVCYIEGVGCNHYPTPAYGQYFPSTPKLPGAVHIGTFGSENSAENQGPEYDMPCVGFVLWALGEHHGNFCEVKQLCDDQYAIYWGHPK